MCKCIDLHLDIQQIFVPRQVNEVSTTFMGYFASRDSSVCSKQRPCEHPSIFFICFKIFLLKYKMHCF
ncbi:hypothetical protein HK096_007269 [Nowakowskiella sp. JEL0078]|nr:hypothetical protein HK096_007269 [Nowakowskiella sp. JEL0078]